MHPYFFEIAIYRSAEETKIAGDRRAPDGGIAPAAPAPTDSRTNQIEELPARFQQEISAWHYNQVIGWLRLYTFDDQIRGELWLHKAKRYSKKIPNKDFQYVQGSVIQYWTTEDASNLEIYTGLRKLIRDFERRFQNGSRHMDLACFDRLGIAVDWRKLLSLP